MATSSSTDAIPSSVNVKKKKSLDNFFPSKLYEMLEDIESLGLSAAMSWCAGGRAFIIKNRELFMTQLFPLYSKATKYRSFQRQCGLWGFHRITSGRDIGAWWHECFICGCPEKLKDIVRVPVKSKAPKVKNPNFYASDDNGHHQIMIEEVSSMSVDGSSDRNEEFERLDKEFEAWFHKTKSSQQRCTSPIMSNMNYNKNNAGDSPMGETKMVLDSALLASDLAVSQTAARTYMCRICTDADFSRPSTVESSGQLHARVLEPDPPSISLGSDMASQSAELDQVETDELSNFIDGMIGLLP